MVLTEWAWEWYAAGDGNKVVDPRPGGAYDAGEVAAAVNAVNMGIWCLHSSLAMQLTTWEVARYLDGGEAGVVPEPSPLPPACSGKVGFDDFVHSYPSSSFERFAVAGGGWDVGT